MKRVILPVSLVALSAIPAFAADDAAKGETKPYVMQELVVTDTTIA